jgi:F-type H+-transporting ATPase subunit epsilon
METVLMNVKILLPYKVFAEIKNVKRIVMETSDGSYGLLPHRLDCVAALVPGIFTYETDSGGDQYIAMDEGVLVKEGLQVLASVRNAIGGADLGQLRATVEKEFVNLDEQEKNVRSVMEKMESGFIYNLEKFRKL